MSDGPMDIDPTVAAAAAAPSAEASSPSGGGIPSSSSSSSNPSSSSVDGQKSNPEADAEASDDEADEEADEDEADEEDDKDEIMMTVQDLCDYYSENSGDDEDSSSSDGAASFHLGDDGGTDEDDAYTTGRELLDVYSLDVLMKHYIRDDGGDGADGDGDDSSYEFEEDRDDDEMDEDATDDGNVMEVVEQAEEGGGGGGPNEEEDGQVDDIQLPADFAVLSSHLLPLDDLQEELEAAAEEARLRRYLTTVHDEDDADHYGSSGMSIVDWKEDEGIPDEGPLRCRVDRVLHGTPLHYACSDTIGRRGAAKIRLILDAAQRQRIDPAELMTATMLVYEYDDDEEGLVLDEEAVAGATTPIWLLLSNQNSCSESMAALLEYWPQAAFLRNELGETTLLRLIRNMASPERYQRNLDGGGWHGSHYWHKDFGPNAIGDLLRAASRARCGGAEALVVSTDGGDRMDMRRGDGCGEYGRGPNVLDLMCSNLDTLDGLETLNVPEWVRYLVHVCPDLLLHCNADETVHPFHKLIHLPDGDTNEEGSQEEEEEEELKLASMRMKLQCAVALFEQSSTKAIAASLMRVDWDEQIEISSGFRILQSCLSVQPSDSLVMGATKEISKTLAGMILGQDDRGRSLLHYLAAWDTSIAGYELSKIQSDILDRRAFFQSKDRDLSKEENVLMEAGIIESEERNMKDFADAFSWICEKVPEIKKANLHDMDGLNPLHYALTNGKVWNDGMRNLTRLFPKWVGEKTDGLYPFMIADDLTTSFELLRCEPGVIAPSK